MLACGEDSGDILGKNEMWLLSAFVQKDLPEAKLKSC